MEEDKKKLEFLKWVLELDNSKQNSLDDLNWIKYTDLTISKNSGRSLHEFLEFEKKVLSTIDELSNKITRHNRGNNVLCHVEWFKKEIKKLLRKIYIKLLFDTHTFIVKEGYEGKKLTRKIKALSIEEGKKIDNYISFVKKEIYTVIDNKKKDLEWFLETLLLFR